MNDPIRSGTAGDDEAWLENSLRAVPSSLEDADGRFTAGVMRRIPVLRMPVAPAQALTRIRRRTATEVRVLRYSWGGLVLGLLLVGLAMGWSGADTATLVAALAQDWIASIAGVAATLVVMVGWGLQERRG